MRNVGIFQQAAIRHKAVGCPVSLRWAPAAKYSAGGPNALTDGRRAPDNPGGSPDYSCWQGFEGDDLDAVVDLGRPQSIKRLSTGFLQQEGAWIFLPSSVEYAFSNDGKSFRTLVNIANRTPQKSGGVSRESFMRAFPAVTARFIRVKAANIGICPEGHPGAGSKAWLFADEIVVE